MTVCFVARAGVVNTKPGCADSILNLNSTENIVWKNLTKDECKLFGGVMAGTGCDTPNYEPNVFFFSCLLFFGTFALSMGLKSFRNMRFFPNKVSNFFIHAVGLRPY